MQQDNLDKINMLLVGNHEPENGVVYKMIDVIKNVNSIKSDITDIKTSISDLKGLHKETYEAVATTASALEKYKSEVARYEAGKEAIRVQRNATTSRVLQIITICIALYMGFIAYKNLTKGQQAIREESATTNDLLNPSGRTRGQYYDPFAKDTIKK